jgi:hypothetical protein
MEESKSPQKSMHILELGFTVLFIFKKWFVGQTQLDSTQRLAFIAPFQRTIVKLKESALQRDEEGMTISSVTTFFKDLAFGFVSLCRSKDTISDPAEAVSHVVLSKAEFDASCKLETFQADALAFFQRFTGCIEIVRNAKSELVYFPLLPYAEALHSEQRDEWLRGMPVGKPRAKLDFFMEQSLDNLQQLKNEYLFAKIFRSYPVLGALTKHISLWKALSFYLVLAAVMCVVHRDQLRDFVLVSSTGTLIRRAAEQPFLLRFVHLRFHPHGAGSIGRVSDPVPRCRRHVVRVQTCALHLLPTVHRARERRRHGAWGGDGHE